MSKLAPLKICFCESNFSLVKVRNRLGSISMKVHRFYCLRAPGEHSEDICIFYMYSFQHWFICRPSDSTVSDDVGIEPRTVATSALAVRPSNHSARSTPHSAWSHPQIFDIWFWKQKVKNPFVLITTVVTVLIDSYFMKPIRRFSSDRVQMHKEDDS